MSLSPKKLEWQRNHRKRFKEEKGYSETSHYRVGKLRKRVLVRDRFRCVSCGMTDEEHRQRWNRPITIDHKDRNRKNNSLENLQTLCLRCHGRKDLKTELRVPRVPLFKEKILAMRREHVPFQTIADSLGFSIGAIHKWVTKWEKETA